VGARGSTEPIDISVPLWIERALGDGGVEACSPCAGGIERTRGTSTETGVGEAERGSANPRLLTAARATCGPSSVSASRSTASSTSSGTIRSGAP
jgi:hypothetical protein